MGRDDFLFIHCMSLVVREDLFYWSGDCPADGQKSFLSAGLLIYDISLVEKREKNRDFVVDKTVMV